MTEMWKPVPDWAAYEVSNLGQVRSVTRDVSNGHGIKYTVPGLMLTPRRNASGYMVVTLRAGKTVRRTPFVHRLVAAAFIPNPDSKPNINHLDCDPSNNHASNLEWCTQEENLAYMRHMGRQRGPTGQRPPVAQLSDSQVRQIRAEYALGGSSHQSIATKFRVSKRSIGRILAGKAYADVL